MYRIDLNYFVVPSTFNDCRFCCDTCSRELTASFSPELLLFAQEGFAPVSVCPLYKYKDYWQWDRTITEHAHAEPSLDSPSLHLACDHTCRVVAVSYSPPSKHDLSLTLLTDYSITNDQSPSRLIRFNLTTNTLQTDQQ